MVAPVCARGYPLLIYPFDLDTLQLWPWFSQRETYSTCNHALVSPPVLRTLIFHLCRNPWLLPHKAFAYRRLLQACRSGTHRGNAAAESWPTCSRSSLRSPCLASKQAVEHVRQFSMQISSRSGSVFCAYQHRMKYEAWALLNYLLDCKLWPQLAAWYIAEHVQGLIVSTATLVEHSGLEPATTRSLI